jgi:transcriptional regulator with XRE-family HTH domain
MTLANRLRRERKANNLSQGVLALVGNVLPHTQYLYETGVRCPRADYLSLIAAAGLDVQYIVIGGV